MIFNLHRLLSRTTISNPDLGEPVKAGTALFYIADKRLDNINWGVL